MIYFLTLQNIKKLLWKIQSFLRSLKNSRNFDYRTTNITLPEHIDAKEDLARVLHGGTKQKSIKKIFDPKTGQIQPSQFMDSRNPTELSVNRVSTLDNEGAHRLGIEHVENIIRNNPEQKRVYHGFAKLKAQIVYSEKCNIVKDDINGTKPYHTMQILSTLEIRG